MCQHQYNQIQHYAYGFYDIQRKICIYCIWEKYSTRKVVTLPLIAFQKGPFWTDYKDNKDYHDQRIQNADLSYPIFITTECDYINGYVSVIDGYHRVMKCQLENQLFINTITLTREDLQSCFLQNDYTYYNHLYGIVRYYMKRTFDYTHMMFNPTYY
jgi:hypothetical protein